MREMPVVRRSPTVGEALRAARIDAGIMQQDLASLLKISQWTLNRVEHGTRSFEIAWLELLPASIRTAVAEVIEPQLRRQHEHVRQFTQEIPAA